jgi:nitroreductase
VDTYLAITSRRDLKRYAARPVPDDVTRRILDAGRLAGSAGNRQPWRFVVVADQALVERLAATVYAPENVLGAALVVAVTVSGRGLAFFDGGRAVQNMFLAAWNDGVAASPNGLPDRDRTGEVLGVEGDEQVLVVLSFGYPARPFTPESRPAESWSARANRRPLDEVVRHL